MLLGSGLPLASFDLAGQQLLFLVAEPFGAGDAVVQVHDGGDADQHGGDGLDQEHPLPARQAMVAVEGLHDPARQRVAEDARHGNGRHEQRDDLGAPVGRVPVGQVQDDAGSRTNMTGRQSPHICAAIRCARPACA
ncbi:hypothetical protein FQR65_LT20817 [Abscondita terminalis]|nr:hypothetical protein FQR65_LT20817 [Abscondita terminalis]